MPLSQCGGMGSAVPFVQPGWGIPNRGKVPQSCEYREFSISGVSFEWKEARPTLKSGGRGKRAVRAGAELLGYGRRRAASLGHCCGSGAHRTPGCCPLWQ